MKNVLVQKKVSPPIYAGDGFSVEELEEDTEEDPKTAWLQKEYDFLQRKLKSGRLLDDYEKSLIQKYENSQSGSVRAKRLEADKAVL
jgi:hypothetical protein